MKEVSLAYFSANNNAKKTILEILSKEDEIFLFKIDDYYEKDFLNFVQEDYDILLLDFENTNFQGRDYVEIVSLLRAINLAIIAIDDMDSTLDMTFLLKNGINAFINRSTIDSMNLKASILSVLFAEEQINQLKRSNSELESFAYVASHDLQEPVRKINSFTTLLKDNLAGNLDEDTETYLSIILGASSRMRLLIKDLLEFSKISSSHIKPTKLKLAELILDAISMQEEKLVENKVSVFLEYLASDGQKESDFMENHNLESIKIELIKDNQIVDFDINQFPCMEVDKLQISRLLENLISNAVKFKTDTREAVINLKIKYLNEKQWKISVEDNGIGIEDEYQSKIFNIFERLYGHSEYEGSGIGLAIVKKIADKHKASIELESSYGKGSSFSCLLPESQ